MYRDWHVDLAGPFKASRGGGRYVILAVEAFTKMAVFGIMSDKEPVSTARFFNRQIIPVFGACGVVVTDGGSEWEAELQELLIDSKIDHMTTTANHPQSNGLVEKLVKTSKKALQKML